MPIEIIDDDGESHCMHPDHHPPTMVVIPSGKMLVHTCPFCGKTTAIYSNQGWL